MVPTVQDPYAVAVKIPAQRHKTPESLVRFAWLSIAVAVATIALKGLAWWVTGSVGLLSDAAESFVNLAAAVAVLIALTVAKKPPDDGHPFGHSKAEYFSPLLEGLLIMVAAIMILFAAVDRILRPQPLESLGIGLALSIIASILNAGLAFVLLRAAKKHRSITLWADGHHMLTDLYTTAGVLVGIGLVALTGWQILDPIVAIIFGINILIVGVKLLAESMSGLMDASLPDEEVSRIKGILDDFSDKHGVVFHALRTRESGRRRFLEVHMLVPGAWTVKHGHELTEKVTDALEEAVPELRVMIDLEPIEAPSSYSDIDV
ncbi:MAG: cation-efflux pump [Propionibacterium sp.]|nr:MAG: cation-efflux pump [Propionibacterium sp.]